MLTVAVVLMGVPPAEEEMLMATVCPSGDQVGRDGETSAIEESITAVIDGKRWLEAVSLVVDLWLGWLITG